MKPSTEQLQGIRDNVQNEYFLKIFSEKPLICERFVEPNPIKFVDLERYLLDYRWMSLFKLDGSIYENEV